MTRDGCDRMDPSLVVWKRPCPHSVVAMKGGDDAVVARADQLNLIGRPNEALVTVGPVLAAQPEHAGAALAAGVALCALNRGREAIPLLERATSVHPQDPQLARLLACAYLMQGRYAQARRVSDEAVRLAPQDWQVRAQHARVLAKAGDPGEARDEALRAVQLAPAEAQAHLIVAEVVMSTTARTPDDLMIAEDHCLRVLEIEPNNAVALNNLAAVRLRAGTFRGSGGLLAGSVLADPMSDVARSNLWRLINSALARTCAIAQVLTLGPYTAAALGWVSAGVGVALALLPVAFGCAGLWAARTLPSSRRAFVRGYVHSGYMSRLRPAIVSCSILVSIEAVALAVRGPLVASPFVFVVVSLVAVLSARRRVRAK